jgi:2,5-diketo-D-gluconate reductase A
MDDAEVEPVVARAIELGYRLVDTAENYGNETGVGRGIRASGVDRSEVFVTTKFNKRWHGVEGAQRAFEASAQRLGVDVIDLLMIHWPNPAQDRYVEAFQGLLTLLGDGRVRAVGTSNFTPVHLQRLLDETGQVPDVNQVQLSPDLARSGVRAFDADHGIVTESWSPIGQGGDLLSAPAVTAAAQAHARTPAQVVLRWHVQQGLVAIPKTADPQRLAENLAVFDFALSAEEVAALSALDRGEDAAADSDAFGH